MGNQQDIPTEARADWIADHRIRVARTEGELHQRAREVKTHLDVLQQHQQAAYRDDVTACLGELNYALGTWDGYPAVYMQPMADSELAEELLILGGVLQKHEPRKWQAILASVRMDARRGCVWFVLPCEEPDVLSLDGAAA